MARVEPTDFLLNTDYEMDKLILVKEGQLQPSSQAVYIPHGLPFRPLLFGLCSFNSDFTSPKPAPYRKEATYTGTGISYKVSFTIATLGDNIYLSYRNSDDGSATLYYRLYGFEPVGSSARLAPTKGKAKVFTIDTDRNYRKLYKKGVVEMGNNITFKHNFGYIPQTMLWMEYPNYDDGYITNNLGFSTKVVDTASITKNDIKLNVPTYQPGTISYGARMHYRIYYDEA